jgi:hypothetical protein
MARGSAPGWRGARGAREAREVAQRRVAAQLLLLPPLRHYWYSAIAITIIIDIAIIHYSFHYFTLLLWLFCRRYWFTPLLSLLPDSLVIFISHYFHAITPTLPFHWLFHLCRHYWWAIRH